MKIAIYGYGNLGKGVEKAIRQNDDMELFGVFTRRNPDSLKIMTEGVGVYSSDDIEKYKDEIFCKCRCHFGKICCTASANDEHINFILIFLNIV